MYGIATDGCGLCYESAAGKENPHVTNRLLPLAMLCSLGLGACATVAPYERERLARPDMEVGRNADAKAGEEHATAYREGSSGGMGSSGGGCGCN